MFRKPISVSDSPGNTYLVNQPGFSERKTHSPIEGRGLVQDVTKLNNN